MKLLRKNDFLLIFVIILIALGMALLFFETKKEGAVAEVTMNGQPVETLSLSQDTVRTYGSGEHTNTVCVKAGKISVIEANCPDKICMGMGEISRQGQSIICLPNKMVITVRKGERSEEDGITY